MIRRVARRLLSRSELGINVLMINNAITSAREGAGRVKQAFKINLLKLTLLCRCHVYDKRRINDPFSIQSTVC